MGLDIYWHYRALVDINGLFRHAVRRGLTESVAYIGLRYRSTVPSRQVGRRVGVDVRPPRAYVGVRTGGVAFKANFFEVGAQPHIITPIRRRPVKVGRGKTSRTERLPGWKQAHLAIPLPGGGVIFRNAARHPGMAGGRYMRRAGEGSLAVVQLLMTRAFREVFG